MSQEHELPSDPRLAEIESQLKRIQPIAPRLDLTAIVRLAKEPPASTLAAAAVRNRSREFGRSKRTYGAIAVSWMCGALAGAALMFLFVGSPRPTATENQPTQLANDPDHKETTIPKGAARAPSQPPEQQLAVAVVDASPERIDAASLIAAALCDPRGDYRSPVLRAGTHLPGLAGGASRDPEKETVATSSGHPDPLPSNVDFEPAPEITRGELMRRLLQGDRT